MRAVLALTLAATLLGGCNLHHSERRAVTGGAIGAAGGAAVGSLTGLGLVNGALLGGAGGALIGAATTPSEGHVHHHYHGRKKK
ncbi:MAG TPA: hypothetical protein VEH84_16210 [Alphaproteobacteria bacterium]|nr:hypothetical protein [Alphaproteobacteria bacterium]